MNNTPPSSFWPLLFFSLTISLSSSGENEIFLKQILLEFFLKTKQKHKEFTWKPNQTTEGKVVDGPLRSASDFYLFGIYELVIISMIAQRLIVITVESN